VALAGDRLRGFTLVVHQFGRYNHFVAHFDIRAGGVLGIVEVQDAEAVELVTLRAIVGDVERGNLESRKFQRRFNGRSHIWRI
jgi:hypothetical protein